jgi:ABC-type nitrate/sulfonate/bicarbonate transport system ATPase subunit
MLKRHAAGAIRRDTSRDQFGSAAVRVEDVAKRFPSGVRALDEVSLVAEAGEFVSVVGPSGCGKTTLFNIVAGLIRPDTGRVLLGDTDVTASTGHCGYMLQEDLLLPWRTVLDNVVIGLDVKKVSRRESYPKARELLDRFGLSRFETAYPRELSGGMRQRCAVIRTILFDAPVFLLDEPFSALDSQTRLMMQEWLLEVWRALEKTVFFITHDVEEAIFLSDRVYAMSARPGRILTEFDVDLPRPRTLSVRADRRFVSLKSELLELMRDESVNARDEV